MGLTNMPEMFTQMTNNLFIDLLDKKIVVFLDNILIYSTTMKESFELLEKVLNHLYKDAFTCKLKKCSYLCNTTIFLGFNTTLEGMCISNTKV